jgi:hypothetical protein
VVPLRELVELATRAPSIHNTQPWRWRAGGTQVRLYADRSRQLAHSDPDGRTLAISCGAALHHAQVAAEGLGWQVVVRRCPDPADPDLLATLDLFPGRVVPAAQERLEALRVRSTDRRRFTSWPLPAERLDRLSEQAASWGAMVVPVVDPGRQARLEELMRRADSIEGADPGHVAEVAPLVGVSGAEGIPPTSIPEPNPQRPAMPSRYRSGGLPDPAGEPAEFVDGVMVLCTLDDDPLAWLRTGETLSALWLDTIRQGLSLLPLSQVTEVPQTRDALGQEVLRGLAHPQLLVRVGWQEITRPGLPRTPRRPVEEVLRLD